jgi:hypothetical protein
MMNGGGAPVPLDPIFSIYARCPLRVPQYMQITRRSLWGGLGLLAAGGLGILVPRASASAADLRQDLGDAPAGEQQKVLEQYREGMKLEDERGEFQRFAGRWAFRCNSTAARFLVLENLGLQRVVEQVTESPEATEWTTSGLITEFRGARYLLLTRAVQRANDSEGGN